MSLEVLIPNPVIYIVSPFKTWHFLCQTCGTSTQAPPTHTHICHPSQHKPGRPQAPNTLAQTNMNTCKNIRVHKTHIHTHWMLTDEFLFLAVDSLCCQFRHILHERCGTHAHIRYERVPIHTQTHIYTVTFSVLSRHRVRGQCLLSALSERRGERKWAVVIGGMYRTGVLRLIIQ